MSCPVCGAQNADDAERCRICGRPLVEQPADERGRAPAPKVLGEPPAPTAPVRLEGLDALIFGVLAWSSALGSAVAGTAGWDPGWWILPLAGGTTALACLALFAGSSARQRTWMSTAGAWLGGALLGIVLLGVFGASVYYIASVVFQFA